LPANPGMENLFERLPFGGVLKDYRAECLPIQVAVAGKNAEAEFSEQLLFNFLKIDKLPSDVIGVEKPGGGKNLAEALAKRAFTCGNSARDPNRWHDLKSFCDPDCGHVTVCPVRRLWWTICLLL
jgi:hypothetical protein